MGSLIAAYWVAWALVTAYLGWLAVQNRHLGRRFDEIEATLGANARQRAAQEVALS